MKLHPPLSEVNPTDHPGTIFTFTANLEVMGELERGLGELKRDPYVIDSLGRVVIVDTNFSEALSKSIEGRLRVSQNGGEDSHTLTGLTWAELPFCKAGLVKAYEMNAVSAELYPNDPGYGRRMAMISVAIPQLPGLMGTPQQA